MSETTSTKGLLPSAIGKPSARYGKGPIIELPWIEKSDVEDGSYTMVLNRMQIAKRQRKLNVSEMLELAQIIESESTTDIRCGAYLLLDAGVGRQLAHEAFWHM